MMYNSRILFLVFCLVGCASGTDKTGSTSQAGVSKQETKQALKLHNKNVKSKKDEVVCSYVRETGTHFKKRICKTVAQIEAEREQAIREHSGALQGGMTSTTE
tara:strand:+ start:921 stop:1229 length:309 start_codon:yes stop_codon:yes gene_type:complete